LNHVLVHDPRGSKWLEGKRRNGTGEQKETRMTEEKKKQWTAPELKILGDVKELTLAKSKHFGSSDGFVFNNTPISG
jgi:hypothetical protein